MTVSKLPKMLQGNVKHFAGNGRKLGYPTANIDVQTDLEDGVYFGFAKLGQFEHWPCLIFIGTPTTVGDITRRVEAHLLDIPDIDYYNLQILLEVVYFYRKNETYSSVDDLLEVMKIDELTAREWFEI
jgi:riboflavin kinase/FMN adenylyltransferase